MMKEEEPIIEQKDEQERQKDEKERQKAEKEAIMSLTLGHSPTEEFYSILVKEFKEMNGSTEEKIKRLFNRLQKFFLRDKQARINIRDGYFCKKREPFYQLKGVHIVDNQIILFGVDFAKHRDIIRAYQPEEFYPVDMSHVKLVYADFNAAMNALRKNQREEVEENTIKLEPKLREAPKGWMQMKPYYISNYERRVLARFATSEQLMTNDSRKLESNNIIPSAHKVFSAKNQRSEKSEYKSLRIPRQRSRSRQRKISLQEKSEGESVISDASFILEQDENQQIFRDMAMRLGMIDLEEKRKDLQDQSFEQPKSQTSFVYSASSRSYRLSQNMPDRIDHSLNQSSFEKKPWSYNQWKEQQERLEEQKRKQEKQVVIVLDDQ